MNFCFAEVKKGGDLALFCLPTSLPASAPQSRKYAYVSQEISDDDADREEKGHEKLLIKIFSSAMRGMEGQRIKCS